jgi:Xaa-Pro aminopeptidase
MIFKPPTDYSLFVERRNRLFDAIQEQHGWQGPSLLLLIADFEGTRHIFRQDSSFYYLTGVTEPAVVACCYFDGEATLYVPRFGECRDKWVTTSVHVGLDPKKIGFNEIRYLGAPEKSYFFKPLFVQEQYSALLDDLRSFVLAGGQVFTVISPGQITSGFNCLLLERLCGWLPGLKDRVVDVTSELEGLRRCKDQYEISLMHHAAQVTMLAHEAAARVIAPGKFEYEIQAMVDHMFASAAGAQPAFPSIVAVGKNATVLHYGDRNCQLREGELVVVDIGAEYGYYAADLTRTYPVNGMFSPRQRELYAIVLEVQKYLESIALPGMYLRSDEHQEHSLHHIALKCLEEYGVAQYMSHGLGHFLGLEVHDVGSLADPLMPGDVFTIEPGIYLPNEQCGIRIEDDYVMVDDGVVCLSTELVKEPNEIETLMVEQD